VKAGVKDDAAFFPVRSTTSWLGGAVGAVAVVSDSGATVGVGVGDIVLHN